MALFNQRVGLGTEKREKINALSENKLCIKAAVTMANKLYVILNGN